MFDFQHEHDTFRSDLALWHGTIMIVVWCVLVPNGVYVSRYLKESFVEVSIFKYRLWFAVSFDHCTTTSLPNKQRIFFEKLIRNLGSYFYYDSCIIAMHWSDFYHSTQ